MKPRAIVLVAFVLALASASSAASLFDPALRFRQLPTEHFVIYYHQREEAIAQRLAAIAEDTWRAVPQPLRLTPPPRTRVVLVDQTDLANGSATPLPYDTIVVTAAWPAGVEFIGNTDDWLRLVFTHEFTHIVHLDRSESWARVVRNIFGRTFVAFPNLFLPTWQIEGLATYEESAITGQGRLHAGDFTAVVREAARGRTMEPLDRVNGGLTDWPGGDAPYVYGMEFHRYLADRFGADTLGRLAEATAGRVPYTQSYAFRYVFGESLGELWSEYESAAREQSQRARRNEGARRITRHGFDVSGPRFDRFACTTCPAQIVYSVRTPHAFPTLERIGVDGSPPVSLTRRYLGSTTAVGRAALYFDQQDIRRNVGLYSDLFVLDRRSGGVRQLTSEARLQDPDLSPDEQTIAAVQDNSGRRDLVLVRFTPDVAIEPLVAEPETQFNAPRWSPDGRTIAVERHRPGRVSEVVLVDVGSRAIRALASIDGARVVTPAWRPDGAAVIAAVAPRDEPFNLIEFPLDTAQPLRQLTHTSGGATWPDVSTDGRTIVFVGYTVDGFDLFTMTYPPRSEGAGGPIERPTAPQIDSSQPGLAPGAAVSGAPATPYSPWPTLLPTSWSPVITSDANQLRAGAAVAGVDVLGYHVYAASATWLVASESGAPRPSAATPDWDVYYAYDRWRPMFWAAASTSTSFFSGPPTDAGTPVNATLRARELQAGVTLPIRHVRVSHAALVSVDSETDDYTLPDGQLSVRRTALRAGWATASAHTYGYSISPEGGVTVGATVEHVPRAFGSDGEASAVTADARAYLPGVAAHHVVALRIAGGVSTGDPDLRRSFHLGGAGPDESVVDFGRNAISLLRGFEPDTFAGSHVAVVNADYRWPIARPQRGNGTWPLFVHTIHAAVFADAGHAWTRTFRTDAIKTALGAEASLNLVAGYVFPFTLTVGSAWGHDGSGLVRDGVTAYVRVGKAF